MWLVHGRRYDDAVRLSVNGDVLVIKRGVVVDVPNWVVPLVRNGHGRLRNEMTIIDEDSIWEY